MKVPDGVDPDARRWVVVVPVKPLPAAKSRLHTGDDGVRRELSLAFALDTLTAVVASPSRPVVVVVTDDSEVRDAVAALGVDCISDPGLGLNAAFLRGAEHASQRHPDRSVAALAGDLPALRTADLDSALHAAGAHARAFVADAAGTGTTLLTTTTGAGLDPHFGHRSRAAHAFSGAVALDSLDVPSLRRDVDTVVDLWDAARLGVGPHTSPLLAR